jgi:hypothetical protein
MGLVFGGRVSLATLLVLLMVSPLVTAQTTSDEFSIVLLPDTQYYSASNPDIFNSQTQWIIDHQTALSIQMVIGEGDIVDDPSSLAQWANADAAVKAMDGKIPYAMAIGNHDYDGVLPQNRQATAFNQYFGPSRYALYAWYGGNYNGSNENFYTFFTINGQKYMVLALEFYPRNAVLTWASSVMANYPDAKVMVVTHSFLFTDGTRADRCDTNDMSGGVQNNNPEAVWQKLLSQNANVMLIVSGHLIGNNSYHRSDLGINGNVVNQIFTNFQNISKGGNGYLRILTFHPSENRIDITTYSPYLDLSLTSSAQQFSLPITNDGNTAISGAIGGKVRTPSCTVIAGAQVSTGGFMTTTDSQGGYTLDGLPPLGLNGYSLTVDAPGYQPAPSLNGTANAGYADQVDFYLTPMNFTLTVSALGAGSGTVTSSPSGISCGAVCSATYPYPTSVTLTATANPDSLVGSWNGCDSTSDDSCTATMNDNRAVSATFNQAPDTTPPSVSISSPVSGTVLGAISVSATASDNLGVVGVQFQLDGTNLGAELTSQPYSVTWNTTGDANGPHTLTVSARDAAGNIGVSVVTAVTVNNDFTISLSPGSPSSTTISAGGTATSNLNVAGITGSLSFTCAGFPQASTCAVSPNPAAVSGQTATTVTVTVTTTGRSIASHHNSQRPAERLAFLWVFALFPGLVLVRSKLGTRKFLRYIITNAALGVLLAFVGCGGGSAGQTPTSTGTPAGTYTITVAGTTGAMTHGFDLKLKVN